MNCEYETWMLKTTILSSHIFGFKRNYPQGTHGFHGSQNVLGTQQYGKDNINPRVDCELEA